MGRLEQQLEYDLFRITCWLLNCIYTYAVLPSGARPPSFYIIYGIIHSTRGTNRWYTGSDRDCIYDLLSIWLVPMKLIGLLLCRTGWKMFYWLIIALFIERILSFWEKNGFHLGRIFAKNWKLSGMQTLLYKKKKKKKVEYLIFHWKTFNRIFFQPNNWLAVV